MSSAPTWLTFLVWIYGVLTVLLALFWTNVASGLPIMREEMRDLIYPGTVGLFAWFALTFGITYIRSERLKRGLPETRALNVVRIMGKIVIALGILWFAAFLILRLMYFQAL